MSALHFLNYMIFVISYYYLSYACNYFNYIYFGCHWLDIARYFCKYLFLYFLFYYRKTIDYIHNSIIRLMLNIIPILLIFLYVLSVTLMAYFILSPFLFVLFSLHNLTCKLNKAIYFI